MINWKALVAGILTIVVIGLLAQFTFLVTTVWLTILKNKNEIDPRHLQTLNYIVGFLCYSITMIPGGYITSHIAKTKVTLHCAIVGTLVTAVSLATSPGAEHATILGIGFVALGVTLTILGGVIWKKRAKLTTA